ncbi:MAG: hypothetical protein ACE5IH_06135 [Thermodesulfobacteriota bacterium]
MSKCQLCNKSKAKRYCAALKGLICSQCCGKNRGEKIECPEECPYLSHESYQNDKFVDQFVKQRRAFFREAYKKWGEESLIFMNLLDMATYTEFHRHPETPDAILLEGMEFLREKLSPLSVPSNFSPKFGERLWEKIEGFMKESKYDSERAANAVTDNIEFIKGLSEAKVGSSQFLKGLIGFTEKYMPEQAEDIREKETPGKIIAP